MNHQSIWAILSTLPTSSKKQTEMEGTFLNSQNLPVPFRLSRQSSFGPELACPDRAARLVSHVTLRQALDLLAFLCVQL